MNLILINLMKSKSSAVFGIQNPSSFTCERLGLCLTHSSISWSQCFSAGGTPIHPLRHVLMSVAPTQYTPSSLDVVLVLVLACESLLSCLSPKKRSSAFTEVTSVVLLYSEQEEREGQVERGVLFICLWFVFFFSLFFRTFLKQFDLFWISPPQS